MSMDTEFPTLTEHRAEWGAPSGTIYIYGLYDPRDNELRYIGKSIRPRERLSNQLTERGRTHRCNWLAELSALGLAPVQRVIDSLPAGSDWQTIERRYIAGARAAGYRLVNGTDGGDGVPGLSADVRERMRKVWLGRKHRPESIEKMASANRGRKLPPETRAKMSARQKGRTISPAHRLALRNGVAKLTDDQVRAIRVMLTDGRPQRSVAAEFGVHQGTISNIARGVSYSHVEDV